MTPEQKKLDHTQKQNVKYCIPLWLRDEQMALNIQRVPGRVEPREPIHETVAVVCFGPSLKDTWEKIKEYKTIISCSGSHKFLLDRGIVPTYHIEVDPREHKIGLMGAPHPDVEYLLASCVSPKLIDHLKGHKIKLWHVYATGERGETFPEIFPRGEWAVTGGSSVGLRAMTIARFLGYKSQHVFGMDGSFPKAGDDKTISRHAADHPNRPPIDFTTNYKDKTYFTTPSILECANQTFHELDMLSDVNAHFFGEGLVQDMAKDYVRNPAVAGGKKLIAINSPPVISHEYIELNKQLHKDNLAYGVGGGRHKDTVMKLSKMIESNSILDYGCGKGFLSKELPFPIWEYDPAIPGKDHTPRPADLVVCTDVLEHIEPNKLNYVLDDLRRVTKRLGYFVIHTGPSSKLLADGRNAHLIQRGEKFWRTKLEKFFELAPDSITVKLPLLYVVLKPKDDVNRKKLVGQAMYPQEQEMAV